MHFVLWGPKDYLIRNLGRHVPEYTTYDGIVSVQKVCTWTRWEGWMGQIHREIQIGHLDIHSHYQCYKWGPLPYKGITSPVFKCQRMKWANYLTQREDQDTESLNLTDWPSFCWQQMKEVRGSWYCWFWFYLISQLPSCRSVPLTSDSVVRWM